MNGLKVIHLKNEWRQYFQWNFYFDVFSIQNEWLAIINICLERSLTITIIALEKEPSIAYIECLHVSEPVNSIEFVWSWLKSLGITIIVHKKSSSEIIITQQTVNKFIYENIFFLRRSEVNRSTKPFKCTSSSKQI